jgi:hypothetical protein
MLQRRSNMPDLTSLIHYEAAETTRTPDRPLAALLLLPRCALRPRCKVLPTLPEPARDPRPLVSGCDGRCLLCRGLFIGLQRAT